MDFEDQINVVIDYEESDMNLGILNDLEHMDKITFPNSIKKIYCINANQKKIMLNSQLCENLKTDFFDEKLEVMGDDYETFIFSEIDPNTTSLEYFGYLEDEIFDLNDLVIEGLKSL